MIIVVIAVIMVIMVIPMSRLSRLSRLLRSQNKSKNFRLIIICTFVNLFTMQEKNDDMHEQTYRTL